MKFTLDGHEENERCDKLAKDETQKIKINYRRKFNE